MHHVGDERGIDLTTRKQTDNDRPEICEQIDISKKTQ